MKYIDTWYINCENNGHIPELHNSDVIRFDNRNYHTYGIWICFLGHVFFKASRLNENGILDKPYSVSIVLPLIEKYKDEDTEDNLTRIKYIVENYVPPKNGMIISIYESVENKKIITPFDFIIKWPYKKQWEKNKTEDYIAINDIATLQKKHKDVGAEKTVHSITGATLQQRISGYQIDKMEVAFNNIIDILNEFGLEYKLVDYSMPVNDLFNTLLKCKLFCSWTGGPYYIAGGLNVPTLGYGTTPFAQSNNYFTKRITGTTLDKPILQTFWGMSLSHPGKVVHYDEENGVHQRKQTSIIDNIGIVSSDIEKNILRKQLMELE